MFPKLHYMTKGKTVQEHHFGSVNKLLATSIPIIEVQSKGRKEDWD